MTHRLATIHTLQTTDGRTLHCIISATVNNLVAYMVVYKLLNECCCRSSCGTLVRNLSSYSSQVDAGSTSCCAF